MPGWPNIAPRGVRSIKPRRRPLELSLVDLPAGGHLSRKIEGADSRTPNPSLTLPDAVADNEIHLILELTDDNDAGQLYDYRRVAIELAAIP